MTGFTLTSEQLRSAPPGVRQWFEQQIAVAFRTMAAPPPTPEAPALAACSIEEALSVFAAIRDDFAAAQVFLELGREPAIGGAAGLHAFSIGEIKRHLHLDDDRLEECFRSIGERFDALRRDPGAALFGFDEANHVYIHAATHDSIRSLWEELVRASAQRAPHAAMSAPATVGFAPPGAEPANDLRGG